MQIKIIIKTQRLTLSSNKIVCGTNNFIECLFDFQSSDWTELEKWALFKDGRNTYEMYIQDNKCIIPAQCISDQGEVIMSVVGRNNGKNITATAEDKLLLISGRAFDNPDEERLTPTYLEEVLGKVRDESLKTSESATNAAQSAQEAADSAAAALRSEKNAEASERATETSKEAAAQSEANSKTSEDAARGYADDAEASKGAATTLAVNAAASANAAAESAKQAAESEKKAAQSERNAKLSEGNAKTSEINAQSSASESAQSAVNAEKSNKSAEKHSTDAGAFADNAELSAQRVTEQAEQVNGDAMQVASDKKSVTELTGQAVKAAGNAQTYMEQTGQIKTDAQTMLDNASQAMAEVIGNAKTDLNGTVSKAKADIDVQGAEIITQATAQADRAQSAADGIRDTADVLQADNEHLKAELKHANRRISVLYDLGKGITHRYETDNDTAYAKDIPSGAKVMDVKMLGGKSVVGNQLMQDVKFEQLTSPKGNIWNIYGNIILTVDNGVASFTVVTPWDGIAQPQSVTQGHKYFVSTIAKSDKANNMILCPYTEKGIFGTENLVMTPNTEWNKYATVVTALKTNTNVNVGCRAAGATTIIGAKISCKNMQCIDLTQMFGAGNEPTLEQCREIFVSESYPSNAGALTSADVTAVQVGDKVIQLPNSISLKSAGSVYDSLEFYEQDGKYYQKHTQRVGVIDLGTLHTWFRRYPTGYRWGISNWTSDSPKPTWLGIRNILCSAYNDKHISDVYSGNTSIGICVNNTFASNTSSIDIDDDRYENLKDFTASLPGVLLYYELATPIVTVTEVDNRFDAVDCKAGDKITFVGNSDYHLPVPNEEEYLIALNEVTA